MIIMYMVHVLLKNVSMHQYGLSDVVYTTECWMYQNRLIAFQKIVFTLERVYDSNM